MQRHAFLFSGILASLSLCASDGASYIAYYPTCNAQPVKWRQNLVVHRNKERKRLRRSIGAPTRASPKKWPNSWTNVPRPSGLIEVGSPSLDPFSALPAPVGWAGEQIGFNAMKEHFLVVDPGGPNQMQYSYQFSPDGSADLCVPYNPGPR